MKALKKIFKEAGLSEPKWVKNEDIWAKAKKAAQKAKPDDLYALTTHLYKKMGGEIKPSQEADKTGVRTPFWFWGAEAFAKRNSEAKPQLHDDVAPKSSADEKAQALLVKHPDMPAATLLNALKSQGVTLADDEASEPKPKAKLKDQTEASSVTTHGAVTRPGVSHKAKQPHGASVRPPMKHTESQSHDLKFTSRFLEQTVTKNAGVGPIKFKVALIQEGLGNLKDAFFYTKEAIQSGVQAFEGRKCFADHPSRSEEQDRPERSVRDIVGYFENVRIEENDDESLALVADLVMPPDPPFEWARALVRNAAEYNKKYPEQNLIGLSINASGDAVEVGFEEFEKAYKLPESCKPKLKSARENGMQTVRMVSAIKDAVSCDLVTEPGARGKVLEILESETTKETSMKMKQEEKKAKKIEAEEEKKMMMAEEEEEKKEAKCGEEEEEKKEAAPAADAEDSEDEKGEDEDHEDVEQDKKLIMDMIKKHMGEEEMEAEQEAAAMEAYEAYKEMGESEDEAMKCAGKAMKLAKHMAAKRPMESEGEEEKKESEKKKESAVKLEARIAFLERELKKRELSDLLDSKLKESGLGRAETDKIRKLIGEPKAEAEITKTIKIFKEAFQVRSESSKGSGFFLSTPKAVMPKRSKVSFNDC